ncbi:hypothetical protein PGB90_009441 [Kerria lacca]
MLEQNQVNLNCKRFQLFRILLYSISVKISQQLRTYAPWFEQTELPQFVTEQITTHLRNALFLAEPFARYIEFIGEVGNRPISASVFIPNFQGPHPLYVLISDLQGTVLSLSNEATPLDVGVLFYINSTLPGAIWQNAPANPTLANPNDFFPVGYDISGFYNDMQSINALNATLKKRKWPNLLARKVDFTRKGTVAMLVSSQLLESVLRCVNLDTGQTVEGNRTDYSFHSSITNLPPGQFYWPDNTYEGPLPLSAAKYHDILSLTKFCSPVAKEFYEQLEHA